MERIKATYVPVVGEDKEATIIDVFPDGDTYYALWVDNEGNLCHNPIGFFKVDMDSFTGRETDRQIQLLRDFLEAIRLKTSVGEKK